ncbi:MULTISPECIES: hypothetical protein [unclassified Breznakia]|uniref:hypothetical protein n=1 Tax=unclassified Breznakia TaxID=2623764 RepID=UPI002474C3E2|nr:MULTISPECIES: hypothetical protein [unclassified Breznakia]MDH6366367.1 fumarate reductase subunit D [Breznakia sp. PH1-1]MDH6403460.1 fumarate reductase subunit D [Breznakia sp. PF1-11]MDH6411169.1 fumarate reductase subunit D [Breznakia sp. PFB1-11]MDH6413568.1 fumarate reductase subunit D [Breznakia sp. PFB1-14]MDH6415714.1 fumarate reductase subunit D [Breznakia sp. PFB1-4]
MLKSKKLLISYIVIVIIFSVTFAIGVFDNPNFNLHDFCMNLASEFLGLLLTITVIEIYINARKKHREANKTEKSK